MEFLCFFLIFLFIFRVNCTVNEKPNNNYSLRPEDLIGIIDESLSSLVAWLEGHSLVQTVFTNLYTHEPEQVCTYISTNCIYKP